MNSKHLGVEPSHSGKTWACRECTPEGVPYAEAPAVDSRCSDCGAWAPQIERVLAGLLQVLHVAPVANQPPPEAIPYDGAAKMLACGVAQVRALVRQGKIRRAASAGRSPLVLRESVLEYLRSEPGAPVKQDKPRRRRETATGSAGPSLLDGGALRASLKKG